MFSTITKIAARFVNIANISAVNEAVSKSVGFGFIGTIIVSPGFAETYNLLNRDMRFILPFARFI